MLIRSQARLHKQPLAFCLLLSPPFLYFSLKSVRCVTTSLSLGRLYKSLSCEYIIFGFGVELRNTCKMHSTLIKCASSPHFVISQIKCAVQPQMPSFLRLQSIACLLHSILYSAFSFLKLPPTKAALSGLGNGGGWCTTLCVWLCVYTVCVCGVIMSPPAVARLLRPCVTDWFDVCVWVCACVCLHHCMLWCKGVKFVT